MAFIQVKIVDKDEKAEWLVLNIDAIVFVKPVKDGKERCVVRVIPGDEYTLVRPYEDFCSVIFDKINKVKNEIDQRREGKLKKY